MNIIPTAIPDVLIIEPRVFGDDRGFFFESFSRAVIAASITSNDASELAGQIRAMRDKVERLAI